MTESTSWLPRSKWLRVPGWHLSENRLLALELDRNTETGRISAASRRGRSHLRSCERCNRRYLELVSQTNVLRDTATAGSETILTPSRLREQRDRIARRLAMLVGTQAPARVLAFPFCAKSLPRVDWPRWQTKHWIPVTMALSLVLGIAAGQYVHIHPSGTVDATLAIAPTIAPLDSGDHLDMTGTVELPLVAGDGTSSLTLGAFDRVMNDEEFLGELDLALTSVQISELESIEALTPRVRDLSIDIR